MDEANVVAWAKERDVVNVYTKHEHSDLVIMLSKSASVCGSRLV